MKTTNHKLLLLKVIGIILVVSGHLWYNGGIDLFINWFPVYSFHMPLFVFVSGYFYSPENENGSLCKYIFKKFKCLIVPYFIWNLVYGIITTFLLDQNIITYGRKISLETLFITPWIDGHQFIFNLAAWFALSLFLVQVLYVSIRKVLGTVKIGNDIFYFCLFLLLGILGVGMANHNMNYGLYLTVLKVLFLLPFYHLGYLYKNKIEKYDTLNNVAYFAVLFVVQFVILFLYPNVTYSIAWGTNFNQENILVPFITSITGIAFWLRIASLLSPITKDSKLIYLIGTNTWSIMMHHLFVFFLINCCLAILSLKVNIGFDYELFRTEPWYSFGNSKVSTFYLVCGILIPIIVKQVFDGIKRNFEKRLSR